MQVKTVFPTHMSSLPYKTDLNHDKPTAALQKLSKPLFEKST